MYLRGGPRAGVWLDARSAWVESRQGPGQPPVATLDNSSGHSKTKVIVALAVVGGLVVFFAAIVGFWRWRSTRGKRGTRGTKYSLSGRDDNDHSSTAARATPETTSTTAGQSQSVTAVDRHTSVRSVITLPPYRPKPTEDEHVLGREGERDGIDVVVEMPTAEDEEALREGEMDTLFQIRLARRRQAAEREARREARRAAQARNDLLALREIRNQIREATATHNEELQNLRNEHERAKETRQRAISSVSYADVGVARHDGSRVREDGSRVRGNSNESERVGLLSDTASIGLSGRSPGVQPATPGSEQHRRGRSTSSVLSIDTMHSETQSASLVNTRTQSRGSCHTRAGSSPELIDAADADIGDADMPTHSPPSYDEVSLSELTPMHSRPGSPYAEPPPDYSAGSERNRRLSAHVANLAAEVPATEQTGDNTSGSRRSSRHSVIPQLPSLRLSHVPQIVIEPSSAVPREGGR